jgi:hypothetical protein
MYMVDSRGVVHFIANSPKPVAKEEREKAEEVRTKAVEADREYK